MVLIAMSSPAGSSPSPRLAEIPSPSLGIAIAQAERVVIVGVHAQQQDTISRSRCTPPAPKARATLSGVALVRQTGKRVTDDSSYDRYCFIEFSSPGGIPANTGNGAALRIEDGSAMWTLDIPDAFTPRAVAIVSPADGIIRRGQKVVVRWSPQSDGMSGKEIGFALYGTDRDPKKWIDMGEVKVQSGGRLAFTVPSTVPRELRGPVWLQFRGTANVMPASDPCPVQSCAVSVRFPVPPLAVNLED